jgi:hypothetical protein
MRSKSLFSMTLLSFALGCGAVDSLDSSGAGTGCGPSGCFNVDTPTEAGVSDVSTDIGSDTATEAGSSVNPLCGVLTCDPDDFQATKCNPAESSDAGTPDASDPDGAGDAHDDPDGDEPEAGSMGGSMGGMEPKSPPPGPEDPDTPLIACQVTKDLQGNRIAMCLPGGNGVDNDPCVTSADCSAGYACVGDVDVGVCRSYCCLDAEACSSGTYCGVLPSRDELQADPDSKFLLPVCVPANDCELLPGPQGKNRCAEGLTCAIVRTDGTTACLLPATAVEGEPCGAPTAGQSLCAEGFVCSKSTNTCLALCRVNSLDACGNGICQGGTNGIPEEYGVCVGARD